MPSRPPRACHCGGLIRVGECDRCGRGKKTKDTRKSAAKRGYDRRWRKFRIRYLAEFPLCVDCQQQGHTTKATDVHHRIKLAERPDLKYEYSNLMPLCKRCHDERTRRGE